MKMRMNRLNVQGLVSLLAVLLMVAPSPLLAQQVATSNVSKVMTEEEPRHDYKVTTAEGSVSYVRILRTKGEIEAKLLTEKGMTNDGRPDLAEVKWHVISKWRMDPVTSVPMKSIADIVAHKDELFVAVDNNIILPEKAKAELREKISAGACVLAPTTQYYEAMINKGSINWKVEVGSELVKKTEECRFFLDSASQAVSVVMDCGNFVFPFVAITFTTRREVEAPKPPAPPAIVEPPPSKSEVVPPKRPPTCTVRVAPKVVRGVDEVVRVKFEVENPDNVSFEERITAEPLKLGPLGREISVRRGDFPDFTGTATFLMEARNDEGMLFSCSGAATFQAEPTPRKGHGKAIGIIAAIAAVAAVAALVGGKAGSKTPSSPTVIKPVPPGGVINPG
ncbi:MAG: hypothetical protein WC794_01645 [Candidatus Doudnabacteria bacterium]|jgi:hypothetical protein